MIGRRLRARLSRPPDPRIAELQARLDELAASVREEREAREGATAVVAGQLGAVRSLLENEVRPVLAALARDDGRHRRALYALREHPEYERPFSEPEPLVTVAIATRGGRAELLLERALPSALAQTHAKLEIVVVGDAVGEATRAAVEGVGDERVRFADLTQRFVHPDPDLQWLTGTIMPRNEAHRLARGLWIADLDDDDALRPNAIERMLALAREQRLEVVYGLKEQHDPSGATTLLGAFPPRSLAPDWREQGLPFEPWEGAASSGALVHAGLRFFAREHVAADLVRPGDFFRLERMLRAGVRFGMLDEIVYDYYPSRLWQ
jgi:Glycosyltransferase like family 2